MSEYKELTSKLHARVFKDCIMYFFYCPGCKGNHCYYVGEGTPRWQFNGDINKPSFTPSLMVNGNAHCVHPGLPKCHMYLTEGIINFLGDCTHELAGKNIEMVDVL